MSAWRPVPEGFQRKPASCISKTAHVSFANCGLPYQFGDVIRIPVGDAREAAQWLGETYGFSISICSDANFLAPAQFQSKRRTVATTFADGNAKYSPEGLRRWNADRCPYKLEPALDPPSTACSLAIPTVCGRFNRPIRPIG